MSHFDAKASNWIVREDPVIGPSPVLIDTDAVRFRRWTALGIRRLLRSMKNHPQYTPQDSLALCLGYSPYSPPPHEDKSSASNGVLETVAGQDAHAAPRTSD